MTRNRFEFRTKAQNLAWLRPEVTSALVCDLLIIRVAEWREGRSRWLGRLAETFPDQPLIVRSSAPDEDSIDASLAGAFESVANVHSGDRRALGLAVDSVIASYEVAQDEAIADYEILVQPMVADVAQSGVMFTRDLDRNAPYYIINYDDSSRTDTVTGGLGESLEIIRVFRGVDLQPLAPTIRALLLLGRELEEITRTDELDIEYAIDSRGQVYLLQVRPLIKTRVVSSSSLDRRVGAEINHMKRFVEERSRPQADLHGGTTVFAGMSDWNPAEIIGTQPKPLAYSLYRHLIMKHTWRDARACLGYHDPFPQELLVSIGGCPYVDVRNSFNSLLPAGLTEPLATRLIDHYLARLASNPELHDKVEFEVVISCLTADDTARFAELASSGFGSEEIEELQAALLRLTDDVVNDANCVLARIRDSVEVLGVRRRETLEMHANVFDVPLVVEKLLEDCIRFGTLPFSVFARCAFIATAFLRSFVTIGALSSTDFDRYLHDIETVTGDLVRDLDLCRSGALSQTEFLESYGHLRPGTYDISVFSYAERPDHYLGFVDDESVPGAANDAVVSHEEGRESFAFEASQRRRLDELLSSLGFTFDLETLDAFVRTSIELREQVKFEFTKNLSAALDLIAELGRYEGLSRDDLAFLPIDSLIGRATQTASEDSMADLRAIVERNRKRYELQCLLNMPDLIFSATDVEVVRLQTTRPNFITDKKIEAPIFHLDALGSMAAHLDLADKVVLIENADPGYDWLFGHGIGGLVTKYGGAASHMAIRCAEFGLPAAIGCGEETFVRLKQASSISLNCKEQRVEPHGF